MCVWSVTMGLCVGINRIIRDTVNAFADLFQINYNLIKIIMFAL